MLKTGDYVVGLPNNGYLITTEDSICRVSEDNLIYTDVVVEAHRTRQTEIGHRYDVDLRKFRIATNEDFLRFGLFDKIKRKPIYIRR